MELEAELTPKDYFDKLKGKRETCTDDMLNKAYSNCMTLLQKYIITGQVNGAKKLIFHMDCIEKERELVKAGIDTFVYKSDINTFIDEVSDKSVKTIEMDRYEREIPDEIVEAYTKVKDLFDKFVIVFTDYTGEMEKVTKKEKDPILLGLFIDKKINSASERLYYIGDWEDEYCNLTLDKLVSEMKDAGKGEIAKPISTPESLDDLREQVKMLKPTNDGSMFTIDGNFGSNLNIAGKKKGFFDKVKTFIGRK